MHEQARVGGTISVINVMTVAVAPVYVVLYERVQEGPFVLNVAILLGLLAMVFFIRQPRNTAPTPTSQEETALATIERAESGDVGA